MLQIFRCQIYKDTRIILSTASKRILDGLHQQQSSIASLSTPPGGSGTMQTSHEHHHLPCLGYHAAAQNVHNSWHSQVCLTASVKGLHTHQAGHMPNPCTSNRMYHASTVLHAQGQLAQKSSESASAQLEGKEYASADDETQNYRGHFFVSSEEKRYRASQRASLRELVRRQQFFRQQRQGQAPAPQSQALQEHSLQRRFIFFPTMTLQVHNPSQMQVSQIKDHGWTRELTFRTQPHVTKLEIKAYLEQIYGMDVERVSTINYLGKLRRVAAKGVRAQKRGLITLREDDWKKAYVIFKRPEGLTLPPAPPQAPFDPMAMLETVRRAKLYGSQRKPKSAYINTRTVQIINSQTRLADFSDADLKKVTAYPEILSKEQRDAKKAEEKKRGNTVVSDEQEQEQKQQ